MRKALLIICFFCAQHMGAQEVLTQEEEQAFKQEVIQNAKETQTIVSDFVQYKHLSFLNNDIETKGKLVFMAPSKIKWEYTDPYEYSAIFKEDKLYINDGGNKTNIDIGSNKMFKSFNKLIVNSIKGDMFDENEFSISYFKTTEGYLVRFVPKDKTIHEYISSFELTFIKGIADVSEVRMIEPSEDYTRIVFENKKLNTTVSNAVFDH